MNLHDEDAELFDTILAVVEADDPENDRRPPPPRATISPETALALVFAMNPPAARPLFARPGKEWPS